MVQLVISRVTNVLLFVGLQVVFARVPAFVHEYVHA